MTARAHYPTAVVFWGYDIPKGHCKLFTVTRAAWWRRDRPIISPRNLPLLKHLERDTKSLPNYTDTALCPTPLSRPPTSPWRGTRTHFTREGDRKKKKKKNNKQRKGRGHFQERLRALFLFLFALKSGQTKVSLKKMFLRAQVK